MWRVRVDENCIGSGSCVGHAPEYFRLGPDDARSQPLSDQIPPSESVLDAAALCPMEAITIYDVDTGEAVLP